MYDPVFLTQELVKFASVTPDDAGVQKFIAQQLEALGFECQHLYFEEKGTAPIHNLYARFGSKEPHFCFAGHTDVVPVGNEDEWTVDPFGGEIHDGMLYGRGTSDMKGGIAAFICAVRDFLERFDYSPETFPGSISFLITGDEEHMAINGTKKVLGWMSEHNQIPDFCLVGEPTNPTYLGEMVKIGRRGSLHFILTAFGTQGHAAYPHLADNPIPRLAKMVSALSDVTLDNGNKYFQPSSLQFSTIDVGNPATNVIPKLARAVFNIRFNTEHDAATLEKRVREICDQISTNYQLETRLSGEPFVTTSHDYAALISDAVESVTGHTPKLSTSGGTSDARFIKDYCPVIEFGLVGKTMHKTNEAVALSELKELSDIYERILVKYFKTG